MLVTLLGILYAPKKFAGDSRSVSFRFIKKHAAVIAGISRIIRGYPYSESCVQPKNAASSMLVTLFEMVTLVRSRCR